MRVSYQTHVLGSGTPTYPTNQPYKFLHHNHEPVEALAGWMVGTRTSSSVEVENRTFAGIH